jgi:hypothetical protein
MAEEINNLKIEVAVINEKLDSQGKKIDEVLVILKNHIAEENIRFKEMADRKADKWVERVLVGAGSVVGIALIGALMSLILIK